MMTYDTSSYKTLNHDYIHIHIDIEVNDEIIINEVLPTLAPAEEDIHIRWLFEALT
jgi:hypothetical protein